MRVVWEKLFSFILAFSVSLPLNVYAESVNSGSVNLKDVVTEIQPVASEINPNVPLETLKIEELPYKDKDRNETSVKPVNIYFILIVLALGVLVLLWMSRQHLVKRGHLPSSAGDIKYISNCRLSAKTYAYVIDINSQRYLVVDNQNHIALSSLSALNGGSLTQDGKSEANV